MRTLRVVLLMACITLPSAAFAADTLRMATTADIRDSGLLDYLKPLLLRETGIDLTWASTGTDKALEHGKNCNVDVLLVHDPEAELKMVEEGSAVDRRQIMYQMEGDKSLIKQYSVMTVNPAKCPKVKADLAKKFADWWVCPATQSHIAAFKREGRQIFFPNAAPPSR
jgi:ABC-type tungstate transport system permease subunit